MSNQTLTVPIFPLPDAVFFPHTLLPLNIFEPRYKAMVTDVLESGGLMGVVQLRPGWDADYFGNPPIYKIFGIGRIAEAERYEDGRYDILLSGLYRAHLVREVEHETYRQAVVEILPDIIPAGSAESVRDVHEILKEVMVRLAGALPPDVKLFSGNDLQRLGPGELADIMASLFVTEPYDRQSLLAETDVSRRQQLLRVQIQAMINSSYTDEG